MTEKTENIHLSAAEKDALVRIATQTLSGQEPIRALNSLVQKGLVSKDANKYSVTKEGQVRCTTIY